MTTTYNFPLLRADLIEYYQEELFSFGLVAFTKAQEAKDADEYELLSMAHDAGFALDEYVVGEE